MKEEISPDAVAGHWIHSHEEDTPTEMVFRPANFNFPPSRGRHGFELQRDGTYVETAIGPTDKPQKAQGSWVLEDDNQLNVGLGVELASRRVMRITSATPDRLVIQK
jgi:hypothetical protein